MRRLIAYLNDWRVHLFYTHYPATSNGFANAKLKQWFLRGHRVSTKIITCERCSQLVIVER